MNKVITNIDNYNKYIIFIILLSLSIIYAVLINPHSQEAVTFGYIANLNLNEGSKYFDSWKFIIKNQPFTFQILIPYIMLKLDINKVFVHYSWQSFSALISFCSVFYFSKLITKSNFYSLVTIVILLNYNFINTNLYGMYYPTHFFYFGQMGMYICLLSITAAYYTNYKISLILLFFNFLMHAGWALPNLFLIFVILIVNKKIKSLFNLHSFIITLVFFFIYLVGYNYLIKNGFSHIYQVERFDNFQVEAFTQKYLETHRIIFSNYKSAAEYLFFIIKLLFFDIFILCAWGVLRKAKLQEKNLLFPLLMLSAGIYIFIIFQAQISDLVYNFSNTLGKVLDRIIVTRFKNLNNLVFIVTMISLFWKYAKREKNINDLRIIVALISLFIIFFKNKNLSNIIIFYGQYINYFNLIIWFICVYTLIRINFGKIFDKKEVVKIFNFNFFNNYSIVLLCASLIYLQIIISVDNLAERNKRFELFSGIDNAPVIFGGSIYGKLDPLYYSNNTWIYVTSDLTTSDNHNIDLFCSKSQLTFFRQQDWFDFINKVCFADKSNAEWLQINKIYNLNYVLVPKNVILNISLIRETDSFALYKIK